MLDISLPGLNGLELQKRVAVERTDMPIIFITGTVTFRSPCQAMKAGAVEFLTKPFNDEVLLTAIRQALERSRLSSRSGRGDTGASAPLRHTYSSRTGCHGAWSSPGC